MLQMEAVKLEVGGMVHASQGGTARHKWNLSFVNLLNIG